MSSDEEDLDLNDETSQLDNNSEDGDNLESEVDLIDQSVQNSPAPQQEIPTKRNIQLQLNQNKIDCQSYDIVPLVAVIHPNPIYSLAATRCFRWIFTGSDDGYVRKWDFFASMNGKTSLSQAQRHHFVDSITMSGVISSWWENTEPPEPIIKIEPSETNGLGSTEQTASPSSSISHSYPTPTFNNNNSEPKLSPVYSMDVQSDALWALQGTESGAIQLVTVRHDEGKSHHVFKKHTGPVSVLRIHPDETGFLSGSWDKTILVK
ncbi:hypothetical protein BJ944DRAFT_244964 [Cunninghamella echinulata]|nr:hypothetical protein BJ944DRAFT_244964 [Cunninghamella echinulata]